LEVGVDCEPLLEAKDNSATTQTATALARRTKLSGR
jgi:hypothetical protein